MTRPEICEALAAWLAQADEQVGPHSWEDKSWHDRRRAATRAIGDRLAAEFGAKVRDDWNGARVSMAGVASSSTSGLNGALTNWLAAARRKDAAS